MKSNLSRFYALFIILFFSIALCGQEKRNSLTISGIAAGYIGVEDRDYNWDRHPGYYRYPSLGIEMVYKRVIVGRLELGTGINYQLGFVSSYINDHERRYKFNDICVPVLLKKNFMIKGHDHWYSTIGLYIGKTTNITAEYPARSGFKPVSDITLTDYYSGDVIFSDIYFDFGYHTSLQKTGVFSISPFIKYRLNATWLNSHQNKFHFGLKINYSLNFKS